MVDEECGIPTSLVEKHRASSSDSGPLAHSDPRSFLLSMSEYDKTQAYNFYGECCLFASMSIAGESEHDSSLPSFPPTMLGCLISRGRGRGGQGRRGMEDGMGGQAHVNIEDWRRWQMTDVTYTHRIPSRHTA